MNDQDRVVRFYKVLGLGSRFLFVCVCVCFCDTYIFVFLIYVIFVYCFGKNFFSIMIGSYVWFVFGVIFGVQYGSFTLVCFKILILLGLFIWGSGLGFRFYLYTQGLRFCICGFSFWRISLGLRTWKKQTDRQKGTGICFYMSKDRLLGSMRTFCGDGIYTFMKGAIRVYVYSFYYLVLEQLFRVGLYSCILQVQRGRGFLVGGLYIKINR